MLRVQGTSMINAGILDGDKIVVRRQPTAENGEIVVALVDDSATVKRFYRRNGQIVLHPENEALSDMIFEDGQVSILGKVVGLMRNYRS
jgi:repressor LexA